VRLLTASVGPLVTEAFWRLVISVSQRARVRPRGADLDGVVLVLEVAGWFSHDGLDGGYVGDVACRPGYLVGVPRDADPFFGVARGEQAGQLGIEPLSSRRSCA